MEENVKKMPCICKTTNGAIKGAAILTVGLIVAKIFGALYKVPLALALAEEGMGIYHMIFPVYSFLIVISSGAVPTAISILISSKEAKGEGDKAGNILSAALWLLVPFGALLSIGVMAAANWIGALQGSEKTYYGYISIAPAVVFVTVVAILKGYFQGQGDMKPTAISEVTEAAIKFGVGLGLAFAFRQYGLEASVAGALLGVTASELITIAVLVIILKKNKQKISMPVWSEDVKLAMKNILKTAVPVSLCGVLFSLSQMIDSFLIVNLLSKDFSVIQATEYYGLYSGYVATLINMPVSLGLTFGVATLPAISGARATHNALEAKNKFITALKYTVMAILPFVVLYMGFGYEILNILYPKLQNNLIYDTIRLLQIGAINIIFLTLLQLFTSVLQGIGYTAYPVATMALLTALKVGLTFLLVPRLGIPGSAVASLVACFVAFVLNGVKLYRLLGASRELVKNGGLLLLAGGIIGVSAVLVVRFAGQSSIAFWVFAPTAMVAYFLLVLALGAFSEEELKGLPLGKKIAWLAGKISIRGLINAKLRKT